MEATTNIIRMLKDGRILVPNYQRAYSWEKAKKGESPKQVDVFLSDLEEHIGMPYYFGHFLFEKTEEKTPDGEDIRAVVDGQQRLTTITIFLAVLFARLRELGDETEADKHRYEDMVKRGSNVRFETVRHDSLFFEDYVVNGTLHEREALPFVSQRRIADACDGIREHLTSKTSEELRALLETVANAKCTTDVVDNSGEAMQMFLFQNNRGKAPSKLEVAKALIMRTAYLRGGKERETILDNLDARFSDIYRDLAAVEDRVNEDEALACACRVLNKTLWAEANLPEIEKRLSEGGPSWAHEFTRVLQDCFRALRKFYREETTTCLEAHALAVLGCPSWALPFVVKTFSLGVGASERPRIWRVLESLAVRHRAIGTKAYLTSRMNDVFQNMTQENAAVLMEERLKRLSAATDWWWAYWANGLFKSSLEGEIGDRGFSRFLLWRYENALLANANEHGYSWKRIDELISPELEHIAPQTDNQLPANGYGDYVVEADPGKGIVSGHWLDSIGNQLVLPKSHNCQIGNKPFAEKLATYTHSEQQKEVGRIAREQAQKNNNPNNLVWDTGCIEERRNRIVTQLMKIYSPQEVS